MLTAESEASALILRLLSDHVSTTRPASNEQRFVVVWLLAIGPFRPIQGSMVRPRAVASTSCARLLYVIDRVAGSEDAKA